MILNFKTFDPLQPPRATHHRVRGAGRGPDTARLCAEGRAQTTRTDRSVIAAHVATWRAEAPGVINDNYFCRLPRTRSAGSWTHRESADLTTCPDANG